MDDFAPPDASAIDPADVSDTMPPPPPGSGISAQGDYTPPGGTMATDSVTTPAMQSAGIAAPTAATPATTQTQSDQIDPADVSDTPPPTLQSTYPLTSNSEVPQPEAPPDEIDPSLVSDTPPATKVKSLTQRLDEGVTDNISRGFDRLADFAHAELPGGLMPGEDQDGTAQAKIPRQDESNPDYNKPVGDILREGYNVSDKMAQTDTQIHAAKAAGYALGSTADDVVATASKAFGEALSLTDGMGVDKTNNYDWWNRNVTTPLKTNSAWATTQADAEAKQAGPLGDISQMAGNLAAQYAEMETGGKLLGAGAEAMPEVTDLAKSTYAQVKDLFTEALTTSAKMSSIPAAVSASKTYSAVADQTGDPDTAIKAALMNGSVQVLGNMMPLSVEGPLLHRLLAGGFLGETNAEFQRQENNYVLPENMQEPFTWKGAMSNSMAGSMMAGAFGSNAAEDYQTAALRYNTIVDEATKGNQGAARTQTIVNDLSNVDGLNNHAVDAAVKGVAVANAKMSQPHVDLMTNDPRYAQIFQATQGAAGVDPTEGEAIARDAYAKEVSTNIAWDHYTTVTQNKNASIQLATRARDMMDMATKVVPHDQLDLVKRWASYDQPSQLQFNSVLRQTIESKAAPDFVTDRYGADYDKDGTPNQTAYLRDSSANPGAYEASYAPSPKVEQALQDGGIRYYRMRDGRIAIRASNSDYTTKAFAHVFDTTGEVPLKPGETYEAAKAAVTGTGAQNESGQANDRNGQGDEAGQAAGSTQGGGAGEINGQQNGDEGNGAGVGAGDKLRDEGDTRNQAATDGEVLTPRAQPVVDALAKAGVAAPVSATGRVEISHDTPADRANQIMDVAASDAAENPDNDRTPPTDGQKVAGNYPVGKLLFQSPKGDIPVDVENPAGSVRRSLPGEPKWSRPMIDAHYGRIPGTISADGEPLDVFLSRNAHDDTRPVAVITQHNPQTGAFDELKVVMGTKSKGEALSLYGKQYPTGMLEKLAPNGKGDVVMMDRAKFAKFIASKATDVPPHPISGLPMLEQRIHGMFHGDTGTAKPEEVTAKVKVLNARHDLAMAYDPESNAIDGAVPAAKASAIDSSLSRMEGYVGSKLNDHPVTKIKDTGEYTRDQSSVKVRDQEKIENEEKTKAKLEDIGDDANDQLKDKLKEKLGEGDKETADARAMFAGEKAVTMSASDRARADEMEKSGASEADIHAATGWSKAADGKWVFEIDDSKSKLRGEALNPGSKVGMLLHSETGAPVEDVLQHDSLFEAYPKLGTAIKVQVEPDLPEEMGAAFDPETNTIITHELSKYPAKGDESIHSIILHELQHAIQSNEGLPKGGNPHQFMEAMRQQRQAINARGRELTERMEVIADAHGATGRDDELDNNKEYQDLRAQVNRLKDIIIKHKLANYQTMISKAQGKYMRIAGEVQAYNVQERQDMTPEERRALPPQFTEKYPRAQQIVQHEENVKAWNMRGEVEKEARLAARHDALVDHVDKIQKAWKGAPDMHVLRDRDAAPENVRDWITHYIGDDKSLGGLYHNGKVYLFSDAIPNHAAASRVIMHEMVGHFGLRGAFGDKLNDFLDSVHDSIKDKPVYKAIRDTYASSYPGRKSDTLPQRVARFNRQASEEYIAKIAEDGSHPGIFKRFAAWARGVLRDRGMVTTWSDNDLRVMLSHVADDMRSGRTSVSGKEAPQTGFNEDTHVATSSYVGAGGRGSVDQYYDGTREIHLGDLHATLRPSVLDGRTINSVDDLHAERPKDIRSLARFSQEEGRDLAIGKDQVTKDDLDASNVPYKTRPGFYELHPSEKLDDNPMFSLRNRAQGDPEEERILDKTIAHSTLNMSPWDRIQQAARDFRDNVQNGNTIMDLKQSWVDALAPIDRAERKQNGGLLLDAAESAYKSAWMAKNNEQITAGVLKLGVPQYKSGSFEAVPGRKGLLDILAPLYKTADGKSLDSLFEGYAMAHRANVLIKQFNPDGTTKEKLMTQPEIDKMMALDQKYPVFKAVLADVQKFNDQLLDLAVDRGSMSREVADKWKDNMYVPFFRSMDDKSEAGQWKTDNTLSDQKVRSQRIYGSDQKVEPIIENIIKNTGSVLDKIYSNEAMRRVVGLMEGNGMERVKMPMQAIRMSADDAINQLAKAGIEVDKSNLTQADLDTLTTMFRPTKPIGPNIVSMVENGKNLYYEVTDPGLYRAITSFQDIGQFDKILNTILNTTKKIYTVGTTLDPRFMFRIMMKDAMQSWIQTGTNPNMFKGVMSNANEIYTDGKLLNELRVAGYNGNEYYRVREVRDMLQTMHGSKWSVLNTPAKIYDAYHKVGWLSEQLSRVNIAKHTLANGGSMAEAAWQGQNTLNWQKRGDGRVAQLIMRGAPFMNAHIQGLARIYDGAMGRDVTQNRSRAVTSFLMKTIGIAAASLALAAKNQNDPRYERLPDQAKDAYWHFFVGDHHFVLPKPFEIGALSATLPERVMRAIDGSDNAKTFVHSVGDMFGQAFGLNPIPVAAMPALEDWANKDATTGAPIVSQSNEGKLPGAQVEPTTSPAVTALAHAMPGFAPDALQSPVRLQHLIRGYTSTLGLYMTEMADAGVRAMGGSAPVPANRLGGPAAAFAATVTGYEQPSTDTRNKYIQQVYDSQAMADKAAATFKAAIAEGNIAEAKEVLQDNKTALSYRPLLSSVAGQMKELHKIEILIYQAPNMSPEDKRERLNQINAQRIKLLDKVAPILNTVDNY